MANDRNAGRKPKFKVPSKKVLIPICLEEQIEKLTEQYKYINKLQTEALDKCVTEALKNR